MNSTTGKDITQALKAVGANNVFRVRAQAYYFADWRNRIDTMGKEKKTSGLNWWIAEGVLTFEGADGTTADVSIEGADYQECGFLDKTAISGLRQLGKASCVTVTISDGHLVFTEKTERMRLSSRFAIHEPAADNGYIAYGMTKAIAQKKEYEERNQ